MHIIYKYIHTLKKDTIKKNGKINSGNALVFGLTGKEHHHQPQL